MSLYIRVYRLHCPQGSRTNQGTDHLNTLKELIDVYFTFGVKDVPSHITEGCPQ